MILKVLFRFVLTIDRFRLRLFTFPWFLPILFILCIGTIFFHKVIFLGMIPLPADLLLNAYFPWHDYAWPPFIAGAVPVKNAEHADAISQFFPFAKFTYEQLRSGSIPLWNPFIGSGMPFLASYHTSVLSPINLFAFISPLLAFWSITVIVPLLSFGIFSYFFFASQVKSRWAALIGAVSVMLSSFSMFWLEYGPGLKTAMWTPLLLLSIYYFLQTRKYYWFLLIAIATAFCATGGDVQTFLYSLVLACILLCVWSYKKQKLVIFSLSLIAIALGIGIASPQLLMTREFQQLSARGDIGYKYLSTVDFGLTPLAKLITFLAPDYFGNSATKNYWNTHYYFSGLIYLGILPILLALFSLFRKERIIFASFGLLLLIGLFFYDWPLARLVYTAKVPFISTLSANRMFFLAVFILGLLASFGAQTLFEYKLKKRHYFPLLLIPTLLSSIILITFFLHRNADMAMQEKFMVSLKNLVLPAFFVSLYSMGLYVLMKRPKSNVTKCCLLLLLSAELLRFTFKVTPFVPSSFVFPSVGMTNFLQKDTSLFRVGGSVPSNFFMPYGVTSAEGYDSLTVSTYSKFIGAANRSEAPGAYLEFLRPESTLINLANIKYLAETKYTDKGEPSSDGFAPMPIRNERFKNVFNDKAVGVYENTAAQPRVRLLYNFQVLPENAVWQTLRQETVDVSQIALLEKQPSVDITASAAIIDDNVHISEYRPRAIKIETSSPKNALLILADAYYPGWEATIDGASTEILKAYGTFRAIAVPAGNHTISFHYTPRNWQTGLTISFSSLIMTGFAAILLRTNTAKRFLGDPRGQGIATQKSQRKKRVQHKV